MASNLTRGWIQYLKNNQIAALQSDPKSGRLNYKRKVTASDVIDYLQNGTDYDDKSINQAIDQVVGARSGAEEPGQEQPAGSNVPAVQKQQGGALDTGTTPGNPSPRRPGPQPTQPTRPPSKYAATNGDAEDVQDVSGRRRPALGGGRPGLPAPGTAPEEPQQPAKRTGGKVKGQVSQTPNAIRKRQARANRKGSLNEDFKDDPGEELSEKEVEAIFKALNRAGPDKQAAGGVQKTSSVDPQEVKAQEIEKLKALIAKTLTPEQRKQLWDALQSATLSEAILNKYNTEELFKGIVDQSKASLKQGRITLDQLKDAWQKAGYPEDTEDISKMLQGMGYDRGTVDNVISSVVNGDDDEDVEDDSESRQKSSSQAITKIAAYIQKAGLTDEIMQFMQENFPEDLKAKQSMWQKAKGFGKNLFSRKATTEDVRKIFTLMLKEETNIVKTIEHAKLGRNKK